MPWPGDSERSFEGCTLTITRRLVLMESCSERQREMVMLKVIRGKSFY
jgi:hypothetical protein